jgi:hypothetical protein
MPPIRTVYANIVNLRLTPREMVLEFAAHFASKPGERPASDLQPEVRVVLPPTALQGLLGVLQQAQEELRQKAEKQNSPPKVQ